MRSKPTLDRETDWGVRSAQTKLGTITSMAAAETPLKLECAFDTIY